MSKTQKRWTSEEEKVLKDNYMDYSYEELAAILKRPIQSVKGKVARLGLRRDPERNVGWFKKGNVPFNKGLHQKEWMSSEGIENCQRTTFRKGHIPHNYRPVGTERVNSEGFIDVKVRDDRRGWEGKHRLNWEKHHGPIPEGYSIWFKDGNRQNCDIENLELVSKEEAMKRNSYHNRYPKEVASLFHLKGALQRQINKHSKHKKK